MTVPVVPDVPDRDELAALVAAATEADGVGPLSESTLLGHGGATPLVARVDGRLAGFAYRDGPSAELVVHPSYRRRGIGTALATALGDDARIWAHGRLPAAVALAAELGYREERVLRQLRRPLAVPLPDAPLPPGIRIRPFEPADERAWVEVNARAFATHAEQGAMTIEDLRAREAEPWFDPAGFLLAVRENGELAGFHWTKVHPGPPPLGEVYVLGVDPYARGLGLGPALTVAGLRHLRDRGLDTVLLYVDDDNPRARRLYESLGFTLYAVDVQFGRANTVR
ncbi:MAG TPA: mycothiol synthase [Mycobacteriales bacterium]